MPAATTELAKAEPPIYDLVRRMMPQIKAALPRHLTPERMIRMALTCIRTTPRLASCDQQSVIAGIVELSQLGLEPSTPLGHAWLIPYKNRAQVQIGYKGYIALADRAGVVLTAEVVYSNDTFTYELGTKAFIKHRPADEDRGERRFAYAVASYPDGRVNFKVVNAADIESAQQSSQAYRSGKRDSPWFTQEDAMWRKTAVRRLATFLPLSAEFSRAAVLDDEIDTGRIQSLDLMPGREEAAAEQDADNIEQRVTDAKGEPADKLFDKPKD